MCAISSGDVITWINHLTNLFQVIPDHVLPREYFFMRGEKGEKQSSIITM